MVLKQKVVFPILCVFFLFSGCASMTPRYQLSNEMPSVGEGNSALLQIPHNMQFYSFDGNDTTFAVKYSIASQSVVQHAFRETLIPEGVHYILYKNSRMVGEKRGSMTLTHSQKGFFATAIEFRKGHTYRLQSQVAKENGKIVYYGWVEELPFLMKRRNIKPGLNFNQQFEYWYNQDWRVAGVGLDTEKLLEIDPEQRLGALIVESSRLIDDLKGKFPHLK